MATIAINAKDKLIENLEKSDDTVQSILHKAVDKGISSIENDVEVQRAFNQTIENILLENLEKIEQD